MVNLGFACQIAGTDRYKMASCRLENASPERLREIARKNLATLLSMLAYCKDNQIRLFRISSDVIPFASHPQIRWAWWEEEKETLACLGRFILENGIRVSMHPGQYTVLNSPDDEIVQRAKADLAYHVQFLDAMALPKSHKIIPHIGGAYGDKRRSIERFIENAAAVDARIIDRLTLENDEKTYDPDDVLYTANRIGVPAVMDNLHYQLNNNGMTSFETYLRLAGETWQPEDGRQKIHYSQQRPDGPKGSHSGTIRVEQWLRDAGMFHGLDVMLEVKDKNISAIKCDLSLNGGSRERIQKEWERYRFLVMRHSEDACREIERLAAAGSAPKDLFITIEKALALCPTEQSIRSAALHIWRFFEGLEKRDRLDALLDKYARNGDGIHRIFPYLQRLAQKHRIETLLDSYSFLISI